MTKDGTGSTDSTPINQRSRLRWFLENFVSISIALALVLMIRSSVIEAYKIPSGSMIPTLLIGDHIFVNKFAYGLTVPFTEWFGEPTFITKFDPPQRGDIIVFKFPRDPRVYYIKRVVGIPGDKVEIRENKVFINGAEVKRDLLSEAETKEVLDEIDYPEHEAQGLNIYSESFGEGSHIVMTDEKQYSLDDFAPVEVPPKSYFVMGDNRDHSNDSRFWGFVPEKNIKGKAVVIWLSLWLDFKNGVYFFRPSRIGDSLN